MFCTLYVQLIVIIFFSGKRFILINAIKGKKIPQYKLI